MQANEIIKQTENHYLGIELNKSDWNSLNMQLSLENFESILRWKNFFAHYFTIGFMSNKKSSKSNYYFTVKWYG